MINLDIKKRLIKLHKWTQKKWLIFSFLMSTITIWFSLILTYLGEWLKLIKVEDGTRSLTWVGWILTCIVIVISILFFAAQKCYENSELNRNKDKAKAMLLQNIKRKTDELCDSKYKVLLKLISDIKENKIEPQAFNIKPKEQLSLIIKLLDEAISDILSYKNQDEEHIISSEDMYVCLHYTFPMEGNEWYLAESIYNEKNISTEELLKGDSTLKDILNAKENFIFYNSKEEAHKMNKYIPDEEDQRDNDNNLKGSIGCYRIQVIRNSNVYINAVISFVTSSKKFIETNDTSRIEVMKYNIKENILKVFQKRIQIELCLIYIMKLNEIKAKEKNVIYSHQD